MHTLIINPNVSESVTELIHMETHRSISPNTAFTMATAPLDVTYIGIRFEVLVDGYATACVVVEHAGQFDNIVVTAFEDPGPADIKGLYNVPMVGMTEAALTNACLLDQRLSTTAIPNRIRAWYRERVAANGLSSQPASARSS